MQQSKSQDEVNSTVEALREKLKQQRESVALRLKEQEAAREQEIRSVQMFCVLDARFMIENREMAEQRKKKISQLKDDDLAELEKEQQAMLEEMEQAKAKALAAKRDLENEAIAEQAAAVERRYSSGASRFIIISSAFRKREAELAVQKSISDTPWGELELFVKGGRQPNRILLTEGCSEFLVGRSHQGKLNSMSLGRLLKFLSTIGFLSEVSGVSSTHCKLLRSGTQVFVQDESTNGTFINSGHRRMIKGSSQVLRHGDTMHITPPEMDDIHFRLVIYGEQQKQEPCKYEMLHASILQGLS